MCIIVSVHYKYYCIANIDHVVLRTGIEKLIDLLSTALCVHFSEKSYNTTDYSPAERVQDESVNLKTEPHHW